MKALNYLRNRDRYIDKCASQNITEGLLFILPTSDGWFRYGSAYNGLFIMNLALKIQADDMYYVYTGEPEVVAELIYNIDLNYTHDRGFIHNKSLQEILLTLDNSELVKIT